MTPVEIAAYIGAGAWLPHIISMIYKMVSIPAVKITPDAKIELGYSTFGPIFNLNLALSTTRKDILVDRIEVILKHEEGDEHLFSWQGLRETISELTNTSGERVIQEKDQAAIALKLTTSSLTEKFVRFQEDKFKLGYQPLSEDFLKHAKFLMNSGKDFSEALLSKEFHELIEFYKTKFWWKGGRYFVEFKASASRVFKLEKSKYTFELHSYDIEALNKNIEIIKKTYELLGKGKVILSISASTIEMLKKEGLPEEIVKRISWIMAQEYHKTADFVEAIEATFPKDDKNKEGLYQYLPLVLKHAKSESIESVSLNYYWANLSLNRI
jgi:hypothetical protein